MSTNLTIFLGGPIKAGFQGGAFDAALREAITVLINGFRDCGHTVLSAHEAEGFALLPTGHDQGIAARDFAWMTACDVYVCVTPLGVNGHIYPSIGSGVEIGWATQLGKPVVVMVDTERLSSYSPFLRHLPDLFDVHLYDMVEATTNPRHFVGSVIERLGAGQS